MFQHNQNVSGENTEVVDTSLSPRKVQLENPQPSPAGKVHSGFPGLAKSKVAPSSHMHVDFFCALLNAPFKIKQKNPHYKIKKKICLLGSWKLLLWRGVTHHYRATPCSSARHGDYRCPGNAQGELSCPLGVASECQEWVSPGHWSLSPSCQTHGHPHTTGCKAPGRLLGTTTSPYTFFPHPQ